MKCYFCSKLNDRQAKIDSVPCLRVGDFYGDYPGIEPKCVALIGSWPDALTSGEVSAQANRAYSALHTLIAPTRSAFASKPNSN